MQNKSKYKKAFSFFSIFRFNERFKYFNILLNIENLNFPKCMMKYRLCWPIYYPTSLPKVRDSEDTRVGRGATQIAYASVTPTAELRMRSFTACIFKISRTNQPGVGTEMFLRHNKPSRHSTRCAIHFLRLQWI